MILIVAMVSIIEAQCPMCRMSAESNLKAGGTEGSALNKGILYLLSLPYLAIMIIGITWYKNRKKFENQKEEEV
ncbi:MAG TPA: hypothetical protein PKD85_01990 [Saprospiraceae bacterium]|nr:hypothetical protein [Saprospiraceae bacterium]